MKPKSKILIIAGSDSSGGAGIQADIKTVTSLGSYALTTITAVTVQNTKGVKSVIPISPCKIKHQIRINTSPRHVPSKVLVVRDIPRTKSGKIVELAVKNTIENKEIKNIQALVDPEVLKQFKNLEELSY